jgi:site-specific recombinase XerD
MKPTDLSKYISDFFIKYLSGEQGVSRNTITAYKYTFLLLITFMEEKKAVKMKNLTIGHITKEIVIEFLNWLQKERGNSNSTRNARLAALRAFYCYLQYQAMENSHECQRILSIRNKKAEQKPINYLTVEGIALVLRQVNSSTRHGRRDLALLSLMYDTGARVQEIIDLTPSSIRFDKPCIIKIRGKGNKVRIVPMLDAQVEFLKKYMDEHNLMEPYAGQYPLFCNKRKEKLTRGGITHILLKYVRMARIESPSLIPDDISCHSLRHSKAMHLLQANVPLVYIRDFLGHASVTTTEIYARVDSIQKRDAIEKAYVDVLPQEAPLWMNNNNLLEWLKNL